MKFEDAIAATRDTLIADNPTAPVTATGERRSGGRQGRHRRRSSVRSLDTAEGPRKIRRIGTVK